MRITSGRLKGRKLPKVKGQQTRPTTSRVKETLFNLVQYTIEGASVLDLFAGTFAITLEAISRGASHVRAVEWDKHCILEAEKIIVEYQLKLSISIVKRDVFRDIMTLSPHSFDLIFADPPYGALLDGKRVAFKLAELIDEHQLLKQGGEFFLEEEAGLIFPVFLRGLKQIEERTFGRTSLYRFRLCNEL